MGSPLPLQGANPYTGMYQARQFGLGNLSPTPNRVADYLEAPPAALVTAQAQTPLVEQAEFWGLTNQVVTVTGAPTGGTFILQYGIDFTSPLPYNASANTVQGALNALGAVAGTNEVQTVTLANAGGGTFTLTYSGQTTAAIAYNAPATGTNSVQAKLAALSNVLSTANVGVTGSAGGPYSVTFQGALGGQDVAQMTASAGSLTAPAPAVSVVHTTTGNGTTNDVQTITVANAVGGTFTLTFGGQTTSALAYNAAASAVQTALLALSSIGAGNATVSGPAGGPYVVTFTGTLGDASQAVITTNAGSLTAATPGVTVATQTPGVNTLAVTGSAGGPWTAVFGTPFANKPIQLIRVRSTALTGGTKPNVVVTSSAQQQGIVPF